VSETAVSICNMALGHLGVKASVASLTITSNSTTAEKKCELFYDNARKATLRAHDWGFAERRAELTSVTTSPIGYTYAYAYPSDCLKIRELYNPLVTSQPIDYVIVANTAKSGKEVWTNDSDAYAIYTLDIEDVNAFDADFIEMFSYKIAQLVAVPLTGSKKTRKEMLEIFHVLKELAEKTDSSEQEVNKRHTGDFMVART